MSFTAMNVWVNSAVSVLHLCAMADLGFIFCHENEIKNGLSKGRLGGVHFFVCTGRVCLLFGLCFCLF